MLHGAQKSARYAAIPLLAFIALVMWGLSSPVGSSPDEDFHLSSVWCGQGIDPGVCEEGRRADQRSVPKALPYSAVCYAYESKQSARCQDKWFVEESDDFVSTARGNFTGDYPPLFYATMNVFVGDDISVSVIAMRVANAGLVVGVMTATYWLLPRRRRLMFVLGTGVALVPLGMFILPSINPSSWAVLSTGLVFAALVGFFETSGRRRLALGALAVLGTVLAAGARADAAAFVALAAVLATVVSAQWHKSTLKLLLLPVGISVACLLSYLSAGQSGAASADAEGLTPHMYSEFQQFSHNLLNAPELWAGSFGSWGLGWLDTRLPSMVWVLNLATFGAVLFIGMRRTNARKTVALVTVVLAALFVPTWVLLQTEDLVGYGVQPRYLLPLLVLLAQVALFRVGPGRAEFTRTQLLLAAGVLTATNAVSLHYNIRRYVTGDDVFRFDLDAYREWWWAIPATPMMVWVVGSVAFGAALVLGVRVLLTQTDGDRSPTGGPALEPTDPGELLSTGWESRPAERPRATVG